MIDNHTRWRKCLPVRRDTNTPMSLQVRVVSIEGQFIAMLARLFSVDVFAQWFDHDRTLHEVYHDI